MTHKYKEGDEVTVCEDHDPLDLRPGDRGTIWCLYDTVPPGYEVTFRGRDGKDYDALMYEGELLRVPARARRGKRSPSSPAPAAQTR